MFVQSKFNDRRIMKVEVIHANSPNDRDFTRCAFEEDAIQDVSSLRFVWIDIKNSSYCRVCSNLLCEILKTIDKRVIADTGLDRRVE